MLKLGIFMKISIFPLEVMGVLHMKYRGIIMRGEVIRLNINIEVEKKHVINGVKKDGTRHVGLHQNSHFMAFAGDVLYFGVSDSTYG